MTDTEVLVGKKVIGQKGYHIGEVRGLAADLNNWVITHLRIKLDANAAEELGFKKRFRSSTICMPVSLVSAIGDVITISQSLDQLSSNDSIYECSD